MEEKFELDKNNEQIRRLYVKYVPVEETETNFGTRLHPQNPNRENQQPNTPNPLFAQPNSLPDSGQIVNNSDFFSQSNPSIQSLTDLQKAFYQQVNVQSNLDPNLKNPYLTQNLFQKQGLVRQNN